MIQDGVIVRLSFSVEVAIVVVVVVEEVEGEVGKAMMVVGVGKKRVGTKGNSEWWGWERTEYSCGRSRRKRGDVGGSWAYGGVELSC